MNLSGTWKNSYGSIMTLQQGVSGLVGGSYKSSTGSSGTYNVVGFANPADPTKALGESVALSIYWRSTTGGKGDASWHWVSGLAGQLNIGGARPTLYLMHAMVATDAYPGLASVGTYIDKLIYTPAPGDNLPVTELSSDLPDQDASPSDPMSGTWVSQKGGTTAVLRLSVVQPDIGYLVGQLLTASAAYTVVGFTDTYATEGGIQLQSLSVSLYRDDSVLCQSLAGSLDFADGILTLTVFTSQGTITKAIYVETKVSQLGFTKTADDH